MEYQILTEKNLQKDSWQTLIGEDYVMLIGSAVSQFKPSGLIPGQKVTAGILQMLFGDTLIATPEQRRYVDQWIAEIPFEVVLGKCSQPDVLNKWLFDTYSIGAPNNMHTAIVQYALKSKTPFVVTTNYDTCLEQAALAIDGINCLVHVDKQSSGSTSSQELVIFKIHGSAAPGYEKSIICQEEQESKMPEWKLELLRHYVKGRTLLIIGYSGLDFEICPELLKLGCKKIVWNFLSEKELHKSHGFQYYLANNPNISETAITVVLGDMARLADHCWNVAEVGRLEMNNVDRFELTDKISEKIKYLWAARLLKGIGLGKLALDYLDMIQYKEIAPWIEEHQFLKYIALSHFIKGDFRTSLEKHETAEQLLKDHPDRESRLANKIALANIHQDNDNLLSSSRYLKECHSMMSEHPPSKKIIAQYCLSRSRLVRYYQFVAQKQEHAQKKQEAGPQEKFYRLDKPSTQTPVPTRIQRQFQKCQPLLARAADLFTEIGDYMDRSACFYFAAVMDIDIDPERKYPSIAHSNAAYIHLGFHVGRIMVFRANIRKKIGEGQPLTKEEVRLLYDYIDVARLFEMDGMLATLLVILDQLGLPATGKPPY